MSRPLAFFLTWTCYGTRLHSDERGSVDRTHNVLGTPVLPTDASRNEFARRLMTHEMVVLDATMRVIADKAIRDHARIKTWKLRAVNVRTTHAHVVVSDAGIDPELMLDRFKMWSTRRMREAGPIGSAQPLWTARGSKRWLWTEDQVADKINYVLYGQDRDCDVPVWRDRTARAAGAWVPRK